jgi:hypothetical protein
VQQLESKLPRKARLSRDNLDENGSDN